MEIFQSIHEALADGKSHSVSKIAELTGLNYNGAYWNLRLAEWIRTDWPSLEVIAHRRKRYYRFTRPVKRKNRKVTQALQDGDTNA